MVAFFPLEPATLGHTLVIPREHVEDIWSLGQESAARLATVVVRLANVMRTALLPEGLNVIQSNGQAATQTVAHLHVHIVPRWEGDGIGRIWPPETDYSEQEKDVAWEKLREACRREMASIGDNTPTPSVPPEDRRKHLDFIQATITRMSAAATTTKSWMLPVVTATYGFALVQQSTSVALLGIAAVLLFAYLDANYLRQEKRFRRLYKAVAEGANEIALFSLNPDDAVLDRSGKSMEDWATWMPRWLNRFLPGPAVWASWSIGPFYLALLAAGVIITIRTI